MNTSWDTSCLRHLPALRLLAALWVGLGVVDVLVSVRASVVAGTAVCAVLVVACCWRSAPAPAMMVAGVVWLLVTGFVVNRGGQLRLEGSGDLVRLLVLVAVAELTSLTRLTARTSRTSRPPVRVRATARGAAATGSGVTSPGAALRPAAHR